MNNEQAELLDVIVGHLHIKEIPTSVVEQFYPGYRAFTVDNRHDNLRLGTIEWTDARYWKCYAFCPEDNMMFEEDCLRNIADFCEARTKEEKGK